MYLYVLGRNWPPVPAVGRISAAPLVAVQRRPEAESRLLQSPLRGRILELQGIVPSETKTVYDLRTNNVAIASASKRAPRNKLGFHFGDATGARVFASCPFFAQQGVSAGRTRLAL
jgi:hypothetical protein